MVVSNERFRISYIQYCPNLQKYKDFDEVLKKANALAKSRDLSGVKTVSEVKRRQGPPPVPPPKSVQSPIVPSSSFVPSPGSCNTPISVGGL